MLFSRTSQLILRQKNIFKDKIVFFSGNIQDLYPMFLLTKKTKIYLQKYHIWIKFKEKKNITVFDINKNVLVTSKMTNDCNVLIYYWPKNKKEAIFQLMNLLSNFSVGTEIFIVGENSSGIKSAKKLLLFWMHLKILDQAKHSTLSTGIIIKKPIFLLNNFFYSHKWKGYYITCLPGVFGYKKIDNGSKLLISTFSEKIQGDILDIGCGSGILSLFLAKQSKNVCLTLIDTNINAIVSSKLTLKNNAIKANILLSNIYSNIFKKFNMIVSNPPFHDDLRVDFQIIEKIITNAKKYLKKNGELRFVVNRVFNYEKILKDTFITFNILKKTKNYIVYQSFFNS